MDDKKLTTFDQEFFDQIFKTMGIKQSELKNAVSFKDDPEDKKYLLLLTIYPDKYSDNDDSYKEWSIYTGRQQTYDYLKCLAKNEDIDPNTSFIIAGINENNNFKPESMVITVYRFLKTMKEQGKVIDDNEDFDINEYSLSEDNSILEL